MAAGDERGKKRNIADAARARPRVASGWPPPLESGERARRSNSDTKYALPKPSTPPRRTGLTSPSPPPATSPADESQLRRRRDLEHHVRALAELNRLEPLDTLGAANEIEDSDSGVPTPRPRLSLHAVPRLTMNAHELRLLPIDHRAGFVLAQIDGRTDLETLIDLSSMTPAEVLALVERLLALGAIILV